VVLERGLILMSEVPLYCIEYRRLNCPEFRPLPYEVGDDSVQLLYRNEERLRGGLVFKAHRWLYHSTLGSRVKKEEERRAPGLGGGCQQSISPQGSGLQK